MIAASVVVEDPTTCRELPYSTREQSTPVACEAHSPFVSPMPGWEAFRDTKVLQIEFAPTLPGTFETRARFEVRWSDGSMTVREAKVIGSARNLNDPPKQHPRQVEPRSVHVDKPARVDRSEVNKVAPVDRSELEHERTSAKDAATTIASRQLIGVNDARSNEHSYEQEAPPGPWWSDLANIAVSMGIAGIAGAVANALAGNIAHEIAALTSGSSELADKAVKALKDTSWMIKEGMKSSGKSAIASFGTPSSKPKKHSEPTKFSNDSRTDFYGRQTKLLELVRETNQTLVTELAYELEPHLASTPQAAIATMKHVRNALQSQTKDAATTQQLHTETQWVAGLAQARLGHGTYETGDESVHHSLLMGPRNGRSRDGVLTIKATRLDKDFDQEPKLQVYWASIDGVAQPIADHLRDMNLKDIPIPMMFEIGGTMSARITRDEGGVVRITGKSDRGDAFPVRGDSEAQNIRAAQLLVDEVLKRSLADWNIPPIATNDAHGKHK
jgi:hypothetical protein